MKCFKCGALCVTDYIYEGQYGSKIVAVQKVCPMDNCDWKSYPTKLPEKI